MPTQTPDPNLDPKIPRRFSESNTAFNALSRDLGVNWQERFGPKRLALVAQGKASPKETLDHPQDALFLYAFSEGFDRVNVLTANWGSGKSNRGGLLWEPPLDLPAEALAHRCQDPAILTREATRVALLCGAVAVGVTELDPRWIYSEVQRNPLLDRRARDQADRDRQCAVSRRERRSSASAKDTEARHRHGGAYGPPHDRHSPLSSSGGGHQLGLL